MDIAFSTPLKGNLVLCRDLRDAELTRRPDLYKFLWVRQGRAVAGSRPCSDAARSRGDRFADAPAPRRQPPCRRRLSFVAVRQQFLLHFRSRRRGFVQRAAVQRLLRTAAAGALRPAAGSPRAHRRRTVRRIRGERRPARGDASHAAQTLHYRMYARRASISGPTGRRNSCSTSCGGFTCLSTSISAPAAACRTTPNCCTARPRPFPTSFAACGRPSPLSVIHDRVNAEARRLLLYTDKSAKEVAYLLGYEDTAAFSRFFAKMNGESITGFRRRTQRE